jgi:hypothetical protein
VAGFVLDTNQRVVATLLAKDGLIAERALAIIEA